MKTLLQEILFRSEIKVSSNKILYLIAVIATMVFVILKPSIYPLGDDFWHLEGTDRSLPIPMMHLTNGSRAIDKYVTYHAFGLFERGYAALFEAPRYGRFFDLFQTLNAVIYTIIYAALIYLPFPLSNKSGAKPSIFHFCVVISASIIMLQQMPYITMTDLFGYQLTACLTIVFLVTLFPIDIFLNKQRLRENKLSPGRFFLFSFLAYSVSVGMETFVVLSWIYIGLYYGILIAREACSGSDIKCAVMSILVSDKARALVIAQFFFFSAWSMFAVLSSKREAMLIAEGKHLEKIDFSDTLQAFFLSNAGIFLISILLIYFIYLLIYSRFNSSKVQKIDSARRIENLWLFTFILLLLVGYGIVLWLQSWLTNINYFTVKFIMPITMITFISISAALSCGLQNPLYTFPVTLALGIALTFQLVSLHKYCANQAVMANQIRHVFLRTSNNLGRQGSFQVPFKLPLHSNDGYPLLPGINAQPWFRRTYRNILNRYYLSGFSNRNTPVFYEKKTDAK